MPRDTVYLPREVLDALAHVLIHLRDPLPRPGKFDLGRRPGFWPRRKLSRQAHARRWPLSLLALHQFRRKLRKLHPIVSWQFLADTALGGSAQSGGPLRSTCRTFDETRRVAGRPRAFVRRDALLTPTHAQVCVRGPAARYLPPS